MSFASQMKIRATTDTKDKKAPIIAIIAENPLGSMIVNPIPDEGIKAPRQMNRIE